MREWEVWGLLDLLFAKSFFLFYFFIKVTSGLIHWWRELARMPSQWRSTSKNFLPSIFMIFTSLQIRQIPLVLWGSGILHHQVSSDQDNEEIQRGKRLPLDDVFITGILSHQAGVHLVDVKVSWFTWRSNDTNCPLAAVFPWKELQSKQQNSQV